jgi:hypothetical protein
VEVVNNGVRTVPVALNRTGPRRSNVLVYMLLVVGTAFEVNAPTAVEPQFVEFTVRWITTRSQPTVRRSFSDIFAANLTVSHRSACT